MSVLEDIQLDLVMQRVKAQAWSSGADLVARCAALELRRGRRWRGARSSARGRGCARGAFLGARARLCAAASELTQALLDLEEDCQTKKQESSPEGSCEGDGATTDKSKKRRLTLRRRSSSHEQSHVSVTVPESQPLWSEQDESSLACEQDAAFERAAAAHADQVMDTPLHF